VKWPGVNVHEDVALTVHCADVQVRRRLDRKPHAGQAVDGGRAVGEALDLIDLRPLLGREAYAPGEEERSGQDHRQMRLNGSHLDFT
jgi:hypothetical protein